MKIEMSFVGEKIKQRRLQLGLSQEELAQKLGYKSRSTINKIELGKNSLHQTKLEAFAKALDIEPWDLLELDKNKEWIELTPIYFNREKTHYIKYFRSNNEEKAELKFVIGKDGKEKVLFINEDDFEDIILLTIGKNREKEFLPKLEELKKKNSWGMINLVYSAVLFTQMDFSDESLKDFTEANKDKK